MADRAVSLAELESHCELKNKLKEIGLSLDSIPSFCKSIEGAIRLGCDPGRLAMFLASFDASSKIQAELEKSVWDKTNEKKKLENDIELARNQLATHEVTLRKLRELEGMGFTLSDLGHLSNMIREIGTSHDMTNRASVRHFVNDLADSYQRKLSYIQSLENLKSKIDKTAEQLVTLTSVFESKKATIELIKGLYSIGFQDSEILALAAAFQIRPIHDEVAIDNSQDKEVPAEDKKEGKKNALSDVYENGIVASPYILNSKLFFLFPWNRLVNQIYSPGTGTTSTPPPSQVSTTTTTTVKTSTTPTSTSTTSAPAPTGNVIAPLNNPPSVGNVSVTADGTQPVVIRLNGSAPVANDSLVYLIHSPPSYGIISHLSGATAAYIVAPHISGATDTFTYKAKDKAGLISNIGVVTIRIT